MSTKTLTALNPVVQAEATRGLALYEQKKSIEATLAEIKEKLTTAAGGETMSILVPGQGKVTVTKPSDPVPSGEYVYVFNETIFKSLPPATRKSLMDKGVVAQVEKTTGGSSAQVRYQPNA